MKDKPFQPDQIEVTAQKQIAKQEVFLGRLRPKPGQKIYQWNLQTYVISEVEFDEVTAQVLPDGSSKIKKKIKTKPGHLYACAINYKNAGKQFAKMINKIK